ncbi:MAG: hypothetical protein IPL86_17275 [Flavobacteriales bacterium]|nr:hypothetical protein [Flavobacteriales bacterium]
MRKILVLLSPLAMVVSSSVLCAEPAPEPLPIAALVAALVRANTNGQVDGLYFSKGAVMMVGTASDPELVLNALESSIVISDGTVVANGVAADSFILKAQVQDAVQWERVLRPLMDGDRSVFMSVVEREVEGKGCSFVGHSDKAVAATFRVRCDGDIPNVADLLRGIESAAVEGQLDRVAIYRKAGTASRPAHVDLRFSVVSRNRAEG